MIRFGILLTAALAATALTLSVRAQSDEPAPPSPAPATKAHEWLKKFEGEWVSVGTPATPTEGVSEFRGGMTAKMFGDFWLESRQFADMNGVHFDAIQMIGYDPEKQKYLGTWVDTMNSYMWHYEGQLDESGKKLTLEAEGPSFFDPTQTAKYRDSYEFVSDDKIVARAEIQGPDGSWILIMKSDVTRKKADAKKPMSKSKPASQPK